MSDFNPNSSDSQFAKLFQILEDMKREQARKDASDTIAYNLIMAKQDKTNGRVLGLESREQFLRGKVVGISAAISVVGTLVGWWLSK